MAGFRFWPSWRRAQPLDEQGQQQARIDSKLRAIERQGSGSAFFAHLLAYILVVAFSAGSLVTLAGDAIAHFVAQAQRGHLDIPSLISFCVSFALVLAMDTAMVIAAMSVRMLRQRNQTGEFWHVAMIIWVSVIEAATYLYMSFVFDHPVTLVAWLILIARAITAPITAIYLSLVRTLPISARDIITQVEIVTGRGVLMDMTRIASDPAATTERHVALYNASATMVPSDEQRFNKLIEAERTTREGAAFTLTTPRTPAIDTPTAPHLPAMPSSNGQNGNGRLNNRAKREALAAALYGAHPTSPRDTEYTLDADEDEEADWAARDRFAADYGAYGDDGPQFRLRQSGRSERAQAAHIAPRGAELTVRESVMRDLPPSKYESEDNTDQQRAVFRVLDWADANDKSLSREDVAARAGVSVNTVRSARPLWDLMRAQDKSRKKKASRKTREMPAVTPDMLTTTH